MLSVDGRPVADGWSWKLALAQGAGRGVTLEIERDGKSRTLKAALPAALPR